MNGLLLLLIGVLTGAAVAFILLRPRVSGAPRPQLPVHSRRKESDAVSEPRVLQLLDQIAEGVMVLDARYQPQLLNASAARMLGLLSSDLPSRIPSEDVIAVARTAIEDRREVNEVSNLWFPLRARVNLRAIPTDEGAVVIMQDVTEELLAQQIRTEFVAHASHELKSPVASLQTLAEAVRSAVEDDSAAAGHFADRIVTESNRLGQLIADLLDLSRLEDPSRVPDDPTDLAEVARREREQIEATARAKGMKIDEHLSEVWVRGDEEQLGLLVRNLLQNAIRYTPDGGTISLNVGPDGDDAVLRVSDTGIGIPIEAQGRVFERFYRVDKARSRDRGGTGLGLAIVKHVAELHGGRVTLESELGRGSTFTAILPGTQAPKATRPLAG